VASSGRVPGKQFHCSYVFLTYSKSSLDDIQSFDDAVQSMIIRLKREKSLRDADVQYYGCLERHEDGSPHFHVLLALSKQVCWSFERAREKFLLPENFNRSVNIVVPEQGQSVYTFVRNHVNYICLSAKFPMQLEHPLETYQAYYYQICHRQQWRFQYELEIDVVDTAGFLGKIRPWEGATAGGGFRGGMGDRLDIEKINWPTGGGCKAGFSPQEKTWEWETKGQKAKYVGYCLEQYLSFLF
jgi:hypothetical protein